MPKGIYVAGIPKRLRKRTPDSDSMDYPDEMSEEQIAEIEKESPIRLFELLKHFPYHNADYSIWLDREFGENRDGYVYQEPSSVRTDLEPILDQIPELTQWVNINGKSHTRQIGLCSTTAKADEAKLLIANSSRLEPMLGRDSKHYLKKEVRDSAKSIRGVI